MAKKIIKYLSPFAAAVFALAVLSATANADAIDATYLYTLSDFSGIIPLSWVSITIDETRDEAYVMPGDRVLVFNDKGMEIFRFNDDRELNGAIDVAVDKEGNIFVLSYDDYKYEVIRCNYRGEPQEKVTLKNVPADFSDTQPGRLIYQGGLLYLASLGDMKVIVTDTTGNFKAGYDLAALIKGNTIDEQQLEDVNSGISGFSVDGQGNMLFTMPALARAYILAPDQKLQIFGRRGSAFGRFGVPAGIVADVSGKYLFVADTLRCLVMVFDRENGFKCLKEFGFRGFRRSNLIGPMELAIDKQNKLYVSQLRKRGVNVYQITAT